MRNKIWGGIMAIVSIIGMISIVTNFTAKLWEVALLVIFALFTADGIGTIVADCRSWDEEKYKVPNFLDEYAEGFSDGKK